jgi:uncharacterized membrane protein (DUF485 family)
MKHQRYGMMLFVVYCALYAGFMALVAFSPPKLLGQPIYAGVNLAVLYGMALIVAALVLALIYMVLCRRADAAKRETDGERPEDRP